MTFAKMAVHFTKCLLRHGFCSGFRTALALDRVFLGFHRIGTAIQDVQVSAHLRRLAETCAAQRTISRQLCNPRFRGASRRASTCRDLPNPESQQQKALQSEISRCQPTCSDLPSPKHQQRTALQSQFSRCQHTCLELPRRTCLAQSLSSR